MYEVIIVGTGASSSVAAWELRDKKLLILDVGKKEKSNLKLDENIFNLRRTDQNQRRYLLGQDFESLINIKQKEPVSIKLKAPLNSYVIDKHGLDYHITANNFSPFLSFAYGGLANAWGAGLYRYSDYDLKKFSLGYQDLEPFYNKLTDLIGISGQNDDLQTFFNSIENMQNPLKLNLISRHLYSGYLKRKKLFNKKGIKIGYTQLAILTKPKDGRPAYNYNNTSFFTCENPAIFTPSLLMDRIKKISNINLQTGFMVDSFEDTNDGVTVKAIELASKKQLTFKAKKLLIGAGNIGSAKILLKSYQDYSTSLPILDNLVSFIPFVDLRSIGTKIDQQGYEGGQLILIYDDKYTSDRYQASFYSYISPLRSDIFFDFPFSLKGNLALIKFIVPAMGILQMFYSDKPKKNNFIKLKEDGTLYIQYYDLTPRGRVERHIIKIFSRLGFLSNSLLLQQPQPGNSIHYAGSIPMDQNQLKYSVDKSCRLTKTNNVYFIDGSIFPVLPAKNLTFTLMANAMRVANILRKRI